MCSKRVQQMCSVVTLLSYFDLGLHTLVAKVSCDQATLVICLDLPDFLIDFLAIPSFPESSGLEPADHLQVLPLGVSATQKGNENQPYFRCVLHSSLFYKQPFYKQPGSNS